MGLVRAGDGEPDRLRAGREQQPVVGDLLPVTEHHVVGTRLDRDDSGAEPQLDPGLGVKAVWSQRHPVFGGSAGEVVLREVRPVHWCGVIVAQHHELASIPLPTEHLGGRETGGTAANDHDPIGRPARCPRSGFPTLRHLLSNEDFPVLPLDGPE